MYTFAHALGYVLMGAMMVFFPFMAALYSVRAKLLGEAHERAEAYHKRYGMTPDEHDLVEWHARGMLRATTKQFYALVMTWVFAIGAIVLVLSILDIILLHVVGR